MTVRRASEPVAKGATPLTICVATPRPLVAQSFKKGDHVFPREGLQLKSGNDDLANTSDLFSVSESGSFALAPPAVRH